MLAVLACAAALSTPPETPASWRDRFGLGYTGAVGIAYRNGLLATATVGPAIGFKRSILVCGAQPLLSYLDGRTTTDVRLACTLGFGGMWHKKKRADP